VNWRLTAYCPPSPVKLKKYGSTGGDLKAAVKGKRKVYFPETKGFFDSVVYDRYRLFEGAVIEGPAIVGERESTTVILPGDRGAVIEGPAIVEERESTTVILPGDRGHVDEYCNLMIEIQGS
jgi:N-methylhydantoinase A/oxoprolinase/acetone carboxylase beta subunit